MAVLDGAPADDRGVDGRESGPAGGDGVTTVSARPAREPESGKPGSWMGEAPDRLAANTARLATIATARLAPAITASRRRRPERSRKTGRALGRRASGIVLLFHWTDFVNGPVVLSRGPDGRRGQRPSGPSAG